MSEIQFNITPVTVSLGYFSMNFQTVMSACDYKRWNPTLWKFIQRLFIKIETCLQLKMVIFYFFQKVVDISYSLKTWPELDLIVSLRNFFINEQNNFVKSACEKLKWRNLGILRLGKVFIYTFLFTTYMLFWSKGLNNIIILF